MTTLVERPERTLDARACKVEAASALALIHDTEIDLVIWNRSAKAAVCQEVAGLPPDQLPAFRLEAVALADLATNRAKHSTAV